MVVAYCPLSIIQISAEMQMAFQDYSRSQDTQEAREAKVAVDRICKFQEKVADTVVSQARLMV